MKAIVAQIQHGQGPHFAQTRREGGQTIVVQVHFLDFVQPTEPANRRLHLLKPPYHILK